MRLGAISYGWVLSMNAGRIARELLEALDHGETIRSIAGRDSGFGWEDGYDVAAEIVKLRRARGERTVGRKVGFTNRNIWVEYGATGPIWGPVYDRTLIYAAEGCATVPLTGSVRPRLEPEIAFMLKAPLPAGVDDPVRILERVEWVAPSFEIVDCHFADWRFAPADSVADFAFHWRLVVGAPFRLSGADFPAVASHVRDCTVTLCRNGTEMEHGVGANALGHPAIVLAHLADLLSRQTQFESLTAGEVITTGTLTSAMPIRPGETWTSRYDGLPGVSGLTITFTE
jgi:2-oxo-3-hexenedioate decarboxylase